MSKSISLTQGKNAVVDDKDFEWLNSRKWHFDNTGYASTTLHLGRVNGKKKIQKVLMHRVIAQTPSGLVTDHINGDRLDNRSVNLRICTQGENTRNRRLRKGNDTGYHGVSWWKRDANWSSQITINRRNIRIGYFETKEQAALAYNHFASVYHGEFATLNVIPTDVMSEKEQVGFMQRWLSSRGYRRNASGARGVTRTPSNRWSAYIKKKGQEYYLGLFDSREEAAKSYNSKAVELYGDRAKLNPL